MFVHLISNSSSCSSSPSMRYTSLSLSTTHRTVPSSHHALDLLQHLVLVLPYLVGLLHFVSHLLFLALQLVLLEIVSLFDVFAKMPLWTLLLTPFPHTHFRQRHIDSIVVVVTIRIAVIQISLSVLLRPAHLPLTPFPQLYYRLRPMGCVHRSHAQCVIDHLPFTPHPSPTISSGIRRECKYFSTII